MFSQDIAESLNRLMKDTFINFTARAGGEAGQMGAMRQALQRIFLEFELPLQLTGAVKPPLRCRCRNRDAWRFSDSDDE